MLVGERVKNKRLGTGIVVETKPDGAIQVDYGIRVIWHDHSHFPKDTFLFPLEPSPKLAEQIDKAPEEQKRVLARTKRFIELSQHALDVRIPAVQSHPILDGQDIKLALEWSNHPQLKYPDILQNADEILLKTEFREHYELGRMLSARAAEKAAIAFYNQCGLEVQDTSIQQINSPRDNDWKYYDLMVQRTSAEVALVDVKNSRRPKCDSDTYTEHTVPRFKRYMQRKNVTILGVLSQFLWPYSILNPRGAKKDTHIQILGEVDTHQVEQLNSSFARPGLLDFALPSLTSIRGFLPPWIFDFPRSFYANRDRLFKKVQQLPLPSMASRNLRQKERQLPHRWTHRHIVPILIASEYDFANQWPSGALQQWEWDFISTFNASNGKARLSLPFLFCSVLLHFLSLASSSNNRDDFHPSHYRRLLFFDQRVEEAPLFIYDPLKSISALIGVLTTLWESKRFHPGEYQSFRLRSFHILQGKHCSDDEDWKTLVAYCGDCGKNPLVLGPATHCQYCWKLICPRCGYCSRKCPGLAERVT